jgi:hypothetical protein
MSELHYRHPRLHEPGARRIPDPDEVNENFEDIARAVNGALDESNLSRTPNPALSMFACPNSLAVAAYTLAVDSSSPMQDLIQCPVEMRLVAVGLFGEPDADGKLGVSVHLSGTPVATIEETMGHTSFVAQVGIAVPADGSLAVQSTEGTVLAVTLEFAVEHQP